MGRHKLLIVDDEGGVLEALERILKEEYELILADSAKTALSQLKKHPDVRLILCDQRMPEMTGVEMLEKSIEIAPHTVRMLLTGYADIEAVIEAINRGQVYRYLTKPWENEALRLEIQKGIEYFDLQKTIRDQNEKLKALDRAKNLFLMLVSHELRTPLTTILAFTESYAKGLAQTKEEQALFIDRIEKGAKQLEHLIEETLDLVTVESGKLELQKFNVDLAEIIHAVAQELHDKAVERKITLETLVPQIKMKIDPQWMARNFKKIFEYAILATHEEGKIWVTAKEKDSRRYGNDMEIEIQISFHGELLRPDQKRKIFEPFMIAGDILNHRMGAGLGLPLSKAIVEAHGGTIEIESGPKKGTLITVKLPHVIPSA